MTRKTQLMVVAITVLLLGVAYWFGSYMTAAQMGSSSSPVANQDPMMRITLSLEKMASSMDKMSGMGAGMMGSSGMHGSGSQMSGMMQGSGMMGQSGGSMGPGMMTPEQMNSDMSSMMEQMKAMMEQMHGSGMGSPSSATQSQDPAMRIASAMERIAGSMEKMGGMGSGMMGGMMHASGMMNSMDSMMQQMQAMMGQMQSMMQNHGQMQDNMQQPAQPSSKSLEADLTKSASEEGVQVAVTFMNPLLKPEEIAGMFHFKIAIDTHSVDLLQYELTKLIRLRNDEGREISGGFTWEPANETSHHREGMLVVRSDSDGKALITETTKFIEMEILSILPPSQVFRWEASLWTTGQP